MQPFWEIVASNAVLVVVLAVGVALLGRVWKNPLCLHLLWVLVLLKLVTPPMVTVPIASSVRQVPPTSEGGLVSQRPVDHLLRLNDRAISEGSAPNLGDARRGVEDQDQRIPWLVVLGWTWSAGIVLVASLHAYRALRFRRLFQGSRPPSFAVPRMAEGIAKRLGLRQTPDIRMLPVCVSPLVWSLGGRPRVFLPAALFERLDGAAQAAILAHELAHVRRKDHWVRLLEMAITTLFWWHPVVWWAARQLRELEDQCCDAIVVDLAPQGAKSYATALVDTLDFLSERSVVAPLGATAAMSSISLTRRITMMKNRSWSARLTLGRLALVLTVAFLPMTVAFGQKQPEAAKPTPPAVKVTRDVNTDVAPRRTAEANSDQAKAIAEVKQLGGGVLVNETSKAVFGVEFSGTKVTDAGLKHLLALTGLQWLSLNHTQVTDAGLEYLKGLTNLQDLLLAGTQVTDAGLGHLKGLTKLQRLDLTGTPVTDAGLEYLKGLTNLQLLLLTGTQVTDAGLERLQGLTELQCLSLNHTKVTDAGLKHLKALTKLQTLDLTDTQVTDAGLKHLKGLTKLQTLDLTGTRVTDAGLEYLKGLTKLQTLNLNHTKVTDAGLEYLKGLTNLQWLLLTGTQVTDAGLEHLKGLAKLQALDLTGFQVTDAGLEHLQGLTELVSLNLNRTKVTDVGLGHLQGLTQLQTLVLTGTQVTDAGLEHLKGLTKLQALDLMGTQMTDAGLEHLQGLTELVSLNLNDTKVTDAGLGHLKGLTKLQTLSLNGAPVTDAGCEHLQGLTKLISLSLRYTKVTDAGLEHLKGLTNLQVFDLTGTEVAGGGVKKLQQALPKCIIMH